jgi:enamine deaminase RidA (YjgF/YER057c/UK114 family)
VVAYRGAGALSDFSPDSMSLFTIMEDPMKRTFLGLMALATPLSVMPAQAGEIVRHVNPPPAIILNGVTIPPGAEMVLLSGAIATPIVPGKTDGFEAFGDTRTQAVSTFNGIRASLARLGYAMSDVVKLTAFVVGDPKLGGKMDFAGFNAAYKAFFGTAENPNLAARSTVQVAGLAGPYLLIEIEAIAARAPKK